VIFLTAVFLRPKSSTKNGLRIKEVKRSDNPAKDVGLSRLFGHCFPNAKNPGKRPEVSHAFKELQ